MRHDFITIGSFGKTFIMSFLQSNNANALSLMVVLGFVFGLVMFFPIFIKAIKKFDRSSKPKNVVNKDDKNKTS